MWHGSAAVSPVTLVTVTLLMLTSGASGMTWGRGVWKSVSVVSHAAVTCRAVLGALWQERKLALTLHIQEGRGHGGACPGVGVTGVLPSITPLHWREAEFTVRQ